jgi:hypothetical protein
MQSYVCKEPGQNIIYLSSMHITQRAIIGHDVPNMDPRLVNLDRMQWVLAQVNMQGETKFRKGQYILQAMKKIRRNGCILADHQFG